MTLTPGGIELQDGQQILLLAVNAAARASDVLIIAADQHTSEDLCSKVKAALKSLGIPGTNIIPLEPGRIEMSAIGCYPRRVYIVHSGEPSPAERDYMASASDAVIEQVAACGSVRINGRPLSDFPGVTGPANFSAKV